MPKHKRGRKKATKKPSDGLTKWFKEEWIDIKTGKPCGRKNAKRSRRPYPACRPTKAQCTSASKKKKGPSRISWKKKK